MDDVDELNDRIAELEAERDSLRAELEAAQDELAQTTTRLNELTAVAENTRDLIRAASEAIERGDF
jgi:outer membrane murein-binding lipoprotein Lpp